MDEYMQVILLVLLVGTMGYGFKKLAGKHIYALIVAEAIILFLLYVIIPDAYPVRFAVLWMALVLGNLHAINKPRKSLRN